MTTLYSPYSLLGFLMDDIIMIMGGDCTIMIIGWGYNDFQRFAKFLKNKFPVFPLMIWVERSLVPRNFNTKNMEFQTLEIFLAKAVMKR